ncbi:MAG: hypothetical protein EBZ87_00070 [Microbacteriaceae bacterium]|nr:hypothetical protein [Microbacteriaceae bacterium]
MSRSARKRHYASAIIGKTVANVRSLRPEESEALAWLPRASLPSTMIEFTDGSWALVMSDPEGNDSGWLEYAEADQ